MNGSTSSGNHPSSAVLLDYVTGSLGFAHDRVVATHLPGCPECRDAVLFWEKVGTLQLAGARPVEPPRDLLDRCLASIDRDPAPPGGRRPPRDAPGAPRSIAGTTLPPSLDALRPGRLRWLAPGIRHSTLWHDDRSTLHLIRVRAGVSLPPHRHRGLELTCVLSGAYRDDGTRYAIGDVSEQNDGDEADPHPARDHRVVAEPIEDCVCIMATTGRLRFTGRMARLLQPVMPF